VHGLRTYKLVGMQMAWRDDGHHIHCSTPQTRRMSQLKSNKLCIAISGAAGRMAAIRLHCSVSVSTQYPVQAAHPPKTGTVLRCRQRGMARDAAQHVQAGSDQRNAVQMLSWCRRCVLAGHGTHLRSQSNRPRHAARVYGRNLHTLMPKLRQLNLWTARPWFTVEING